MKMRYLFLCCVLSFSAFALQKPDFGLEESLLIDASSDADTLVVAFGGVGLKLGMSVFEFRKMLSNFDTRLLFVKDYQRKFYLQGLLPGGNTDSALAILKDAIEEIHPKRICVIGNSAGGHAALLFGFLLLRDGFPVEQVHAFSPRFRIKDECLKYPHIQPKYFKIVDVLSRHKASSGVFNIHYGLNSKEDVEYARKLRKFKWIEHFRYKGQGHSLIKVLKERGDLYQILEDMICP